MRIFTFLVPDPEAFVEEFTQLIQSRPTVGLIVDVRGNGGGDIRAAERLLQVLTPHEIVPEPTQFIVSPLVRRLVKANLADPIDLTSWLQSVDDAVESGATFSTGFPITPTRDVNDVGQGYYGPVVLITDARCYSATDIFAAGFQDHDIGPIVGVAERTGAGGANVWTQFLFRELLPARNNPLKELPRGASFRVAVRRTTRVGSHASELLEDLGVEADTVHPITDIDLLEDNRDLIEAAVAEMRGRVLRRLEADLSRAGNGVTIEVATTNLDRVDAYLDGRPVASQDVQGDRCTIVVPASLVGGGGELRLEGFQGTSLGAARRLVIPSG